MVDIQASPLQRVDWHCHGAVWHSWPEGTEQPVTLVGAGMSQALPICGLGWELSCGHGVAALLFAALFWLAPTCT